MPRKYTRSKWGSGCIIKVWFPEWPLFLEVKILAKKCSGQRSVSAVRSLDMVASRRSAIGILIWDLKLCLL